MPTAYPLPTNVSPPTVANTASLLRIVAFGLISAAAITSRLFAVINFESIVQELNSGTGSIQQHGTLLVVL
ncbi:hypothetical protein BT96DRAFT_1086584 [Gymnopus androsaceus JB14]|uniref:Uncharacterized protein n=1 Tax=Gymnopus androsaceus JB14 TaxID=1447944 RepID=A0A6A4GLV2_9AGAR|nr:hypothetical protein BT96DRAFT_1086584 [Gymnopus androsaceus JB14]